MDKKDMNDAISELKKLRWSQDKVKKYFNSLPWMIGCNYIPATAINQLEMFQDRDWNPEQIKKELTWAKDLGFNVLRVYLHYLLWKNEKDAFFKHLDEFLTICNDKGMKVLLVLFDDCWCQEPKYGIQPKPVPSVHNSGWAASPGRELILDENKHEDVLQYQIETMEHFKEDERILGWDLYNEPGNTKIFEKTFPFLIKSFRTARQINPSQPITVGIWQWNKLYWLIKKAWKPLYKLSASASDFISFHNYSNAKHLQTQIYKLKKFNRPLLCSEYMARPNKSKFITHLPIFKKEHIHCINWGLVDGKTQTKWKWGTKEGSPEPELWFHDILHPDGTPYLQKEADFIRNIRKN